MAAFFYILIFVKQLLKNYSFVVLEFDFEIIFR